MHRETQFDPILNGRWGEEDYVPAKLGGRGCLPMVLDACKVPLPIIKLRGSSLYSALKWEGTIRRGDGPLEGRLVGGGGGCSI